MKTDSSTVTAISLRIGDINMIKLSSFATTHQPSRPRDAMAAVSARFGGGSPPASSVAQSPLTPCSVCGCPILWESHAGEIHCYCCAPPEDADQVAQKIDILMYDDGTLGAHFHGSPSSTDTRSTHNSLATDDEAATHDPDLTSDFWSQRHASPCDFRELEEACGGELYDESAYDEEMLIERNIFSRIVCGEGPDARAAAYRELDDLLEEIWLRS